MRRASSAHSLCRRYPPARTIAPNDSRAAELLSRFLREEAAGLPHPKLRVEPTTLQQLRMRALFNDATLFHDDEPIHRRDRREAVCDRDHRLAAHQPLEARL